MTPSPKTIDLMFDGARWTAITCLSLMLASSLLPLVLDRTSSGSTLIATELVLAAVAAAAFDLMAVGCVYKRRYRYAIGCVIGGCVLSVVVSINLLRLIAVSA